MTEIRQNCVYRDSEPLFHIERQDNCIALIPMAYYTDWLDEQMEAIDRSADK